jgi:GxxExxY protein
MELLHKELTDKILKAFFDVYNELGYGFLEKVYQNALFIELKARGFQVEAQKQIKVFYKGNEVGEYYADLVVNELVILELKAAEYFIKEFEWQLINYLRGTLMEVGLLLNFGKKPEFIRKVYENTRKNMR